MDEGRIDFSRYEGQLGPITWRDNDLVTRIERETVEELLRAELKRMGGDTMNLERSPDFIEESEVEPEEDDDDEEESKDEEDEEDLENA